MKHSYKKVFFLQNSHAKRHSTLYTGAHHIFLIPLLLCCLTLAGCDTEQEATTTSSTELETFMDDLFREQITSNTLTLHYTLKNPADYGITDITPTLGSYDTSTLESNKQETIACLQELEQIDTASLSEYMSFQYDVLHQYLESTIEGYTYTFYSEPLSPTTGIQAQLPVLLSEYSFYTKEDIDTYLALLSDVPNYFDSILTFEQQKADKGLFMAEFAVEDICDQCNSFLSQETNFLISSFASRLDTVEGLTASEKNKYISMNEVCITAEVLPAYETLVSGLKEISSEHAGIDGGLYYLEGGSEYYEYLAKQTTGSDRSVEEMSNLLSYYFMEDIARMQEIVEGNPSLETSSQSFTSNATPEEMLEQLREEMQSDFPTPVDVNYTVKYVDKSMEDYLSPAFYLTPPIDDASSNVIYINNGREKRQLDLYTTLAHEGYPGHLYQNTMAASYDLPAIRSLMYYGGYTEGWATYVEMYAYDFSGIDKASSEYLRIQNALNLYLYARLDMGIHGEGWKLDEVKEFLNNFGITSEEACQSVYHYIIEEPANYLKYCIGYLEFRALRDYAQQNMKEDYDAKEFHSFLLESGSAPFALLQTRLKKFYL